MHEFKDIRNILVIKLRNIGDVILTVPVFRALRENFPDAHISALVNSGTEDVLTGNLLIDEVIAFDRGMKNENTLRKCAGELAFLKTIRGKGFDMTVDLTSGDRASIISFISGARYRLACDPEQDGFLGKRHLYTHLAKKDLNQHMVLQNLNVVKQFGINTVNLAVDIFIPEDARMFVKRLFEENGITESDKVIHIHPTSRWLFKCCKDEYMAETINWLIAEGINVIVTSSPDKREMEKAKRILSLCPSLVTRHSSLLLDLCGKLTIKQLAAISKASDLFFGVDSAPMHIAAAAGTPVVAMFGPSWTLHWGPWDSKISNPKNIYPERTGLQPFGIHTVIQKDWQCIPCGKAGCNGSKTSKCLDDITPEEIKSVLGNILVNRK